MITLYNPELARNILRRNSIDKRKLHRELTKVYRSARIKGTATTYSGDLMSAFRWQDSPQGFDFWVALYQYHAVANRFR